VVIATILLRWRANRQLGIDAIYLASAFFLRDAVSLGKLLQTSRASLLFLTSDRQLKTAASAEALAVFDPEQL
jgi:hypothetical protein